MISRSTIEVLVNIFGLFELHFSFQSFALLFLLALPPLLPGTLPPFEVVPDFRAFFVAVKVLDLFQVAHLRILQKRQF
jgi:hypothetical protein